MFLINPYIIHELDNLEYVVQTKNSITIIKNVNIVSMLYALEKENVSVISEIEIGIHLNNIKVEETIRFLLQNGIILKQPEIETTIKRVVLVSNNERFNEIFKINFEEYYKEMLIITFDEYRDVDYRETDLCIIFMNPFIYKKNFEINRFFINMDAIIKNIFYYNNSLYVTNYYNKNWYNPCPLCFFANLESNLRGTINNTNLNYQVLIDIIYSKKANFPIEAKLQNYDYITLIYILLHQFNMFTECKNEIINEINQIVISKNLVIKDAAYYWEECDCYE